MINSVNEFLRLRMSVVKEEYDRATYDDAPIEVWFETINAHPEMKEWIIHNKTVPLEILYVLAIDRDPEVRSKVAAKRKIDHKIFNQLSCDQDELVRHALMHNSMLSRDQLSLIKIDDSEWLQTSLKEIIENKFFS